MGKVAGGKSFRGDIETSAGRKSFRGDIETSAFHRLFGRFIREPRETVIGWYTSLGFKRSGLEFKVGRIHLWVDLKSRKCLNQGKDQGLSPSAP